MDADAATKSVVQDSTNGGPAVAVGGPSDPSPTTNDVDSLGRQHRRGVKGRFVKGDGDASEASERLAADRELLPGIDGRSSPWVRRCRALLADHIADLGGPAAVSSAQYSTLRRAAALETELDRLELSFAAAGEASDAKLDLYARVSGNMRRLLESAYAEGLRRQSKDVTPTVEAYAAHINAQKAATP